MNRNREKYLQLLAKEYPNVRTASAQIVNLSSILKLPKGTEYFFSDLHGEHEAFRRLLRSASGIIRDKITYLFENSMTEGEQNQLANLVYFPEDFLSAIALFKRDMSEWKRFTIYRLIALCKEVAGKYTRDKVREALPADFAKPIDELLHVNTDDEDKKNYYNQIVYSIIESGCVDEFIIAMCNMIQTLSVYKLHIIGDIFDRGARADIIMNELLAFHDVDVQWGNHDVDWMGAACGNPACVATVLRLGISYNNFDCLEDGYGINLRPLSMFAAQVYGDDPCERFAPHLLDENEYDTIAPDLAAKMHKAMTIIQLKLEGQLIHRHPEYEMEDRLLLERIDYEKGCVMIDGVEHELLDKHFPTIDPKDPLKLTDDEQHLMDVLTSSFAHSSLLQKHVQFLYSHGSMYTCMNSNLMFHGCIPMNEDGSFASMVIDGKRCAGKELFDRLNEIARDAYFLPERHAKRKKDCVDMLWYLWCGRMSPVFGKSKMATFEGYFIADPSCKKEIYNPYYELSREERIVDMLLEEFGLPAGTSHIVNGHVPVKPIKGESPIKANGKLFVIDGGISKAYQSRTGIAGYTLIYNSHHLALAEHRSTLELAVGEEYSPQVQIIEPMKRRVLVEDTDEGRLLAEQIEDLKELVHAYREGRIKENMVRK